MSPERWRQVEEIYHLAVECEPARRDAFLAEACDGDGELRQEVESLLAMEKQTDDFMAAPALGRVAEAMAEDPAVDAEPLDSMAGRQIGNYRLVEEIAQGGMGAVYRAVRVDDQYQKQVAIKLVKRGMDTDFIVRHFRSERQILAGLEHPNIARLLDGGATEDDRPYFVMEYIEGQPLVEYCDARKLSTAERLKLFRHVCSAVQYAHQRLIVHRDLKPGNILVTNEGTPKLLDFGIAKLLSDGPVEPTVTAQRLMTPEYASPEQVRGEPVTTATDVYALGVVLFRLLTGHSPYRVKTSSPQELAQAVCEVEPDKPSTAIARVEEVTGADGLRTTLTPEFVSATREGRPEKLRRRLSGELDTIVLKALRKEPERRYSSVEQFSEDIRRHLEGLPVMARKDTLGYRTVKFVQRHKTGVIAAALVAFSLVGGAAAAMWQARVADRRFQDLRKLANSVVFEFHDAIRDLAGSTSARALMVKRSLEYLDGMAREAGGDRVLQREVAAAYEKLGEVQGAFGEANLGDPAGSLASHRKALAMREALAAVEPNNPAARLALARAHSQVGRVFESTSDIAAALEHYRKAQAIREALLPAHPGKIQLQKEVAIGYYELASAYGETSDSAKIVDLFSKALEGFEAVSKAKPQDVADRGNVALTHKRIGALKGESADYAAALAHFRKALVIEEANCAQYPNNAEMRMALSFTYGDIGHNLALAGDKQGGLASYRKSLAIREALAAADPRNARAHLALAGTCYRMAPILAEAGDLDSALKSGLRAVSILKAWSTAGGDRTRTELGSAYARLGRVHHSAKNWREARSWYQQALEIFQGLRAAGKLTASYAPYLDEIAKDMAKCDQELAR